MPKKIQTKRELMQYIKRANSYLSQYNATFRYDMRLRRNCGYSALVRVEAPTNGLISPNDLCDEIKLVAGRQGLPYWHLLEYLRSDLDDFAFSLGHTIGFEL